MRYSATNGPQAKASGNGLSNNRPFGTPDNATSLTATQNEEVANSALQYKLGRYVDTTANANNFGAIVSTTQLANEFKPYYEVKGNFCIWYDFAIIKLDHLFNSLTHMGLVRRFDATMRLWINTGTVNVDVGDIGTPDINYSLTTANNSFSNSCPLMISYLGDNALGVPAGTTNIVAGLYISKPPVTTFAGVNLAASNASHPLLNCRLYYSQIAVESNRAVDYVNNNRAKKVIYRTFVSNLYNNIGAGNAFNSLINSGIVHPTGVLIVPFMSAGSGFGDYQWKSPFDSCPATTSPCSITNLQVAIGGQNILQSNLFYNYEHFISQVNVAESLTSSDFGVSCGLFNQKYWESSRWYYVNVERSQAGDKLLPRNVNVSFNNNSSVPIDVMVFIFYSDEFVVDVERGIIKK
jgi:hypothetical protein